MVLPLSVIWLVFRDTPEEPRAIAVSIVVVVLLVLEAIGRASLVPHLRRQVPSEVPRDGGDAGLMQFGFEVGAGVRTHLTSTLPPAVIATALLLAPSWWALATVSLAFGSVRGLWPFAKGVVSSEAGWSRMAQRVAEVSSVGGFVVLGAIGAGVWLEH